MGTFYLVPHFERMTARDIYLLGLYADRIVVSDGLMFWKFFSQGLPLLSYLSRDQQAVAIGELAQQTPAQREVLLAYKALIEADILHHAWLAGPTWLVGSKRNDSLVERKAVADFNERFKSRRPEIGAAIHDVVRANPRLSSSEAVREARLLVGQGVIAEIVAQSRKDQSASAADKIQGKLERRFREHLRGYMRTERYADKWSSSAREGSYAGYLADVLKDIAARHDLIPFFSSPEFTEYLSAMSLQIPSWNQVLRARRRKMLEEQLGFQTLKDLPDVGLADIDDVCKLRQLLGGELDEYRQRMRAVAARMAPNRATGIDDTDEISYAINTELIPAARELEVQLAKARKSSVNKWSAGAAAVTAAGVAVGAWFGFHLDVMVGLAVPALAGAVGLGASMRSASERRAELRTDPRYFGLSLVSSLRKRRKG